MIDHERDKREGGLVVDKTEAFGGNTERKYRALLV
jgi:hypothetical protein